MMKDNKRIPERIPRSLCEKCKHYGTSHCRPKPLMTKPGDVYIHTLLVLKNAPPTIEGQLSALLHDVGKPSTRKIIENATRFLGHERVSGKMARAILTRLKFDNATINKVVKIVQNHMRPHHLKKATPKGIRRFMREMGDEMIDAILDMARADEIGTLPSGNFIPKLRQKILDIQHSPVQVQPKSVLDGNEIMETLGVSPGPIVQKVKEYLLDKQDELASIGRALDKDEARRLIKGKFGNK